MSAETIEIAVVAELICQIVEALDECPINKAEGCWTHEMPDTWFIAANGHREPKHVPDAPNHMAFTVQPFDFAMWHNGWLVASFNMKGGVPLLVPEDELIAVLEAEASATESCVEIGGAFRLAQSVERV